MAVRYIIKYRMKEFYVGKCKFSGDRIHFWSFKSKETQIVENIPH